ncbi:hypothetical protein A5647_02005 [Mycobacterium sp. 1100029.7]|nr:hypothetical protein A5647_02005 [Mycobacterium sp. 1100029.7]
MADIGAVWNRSAAVERAMVTGWFAGVVLPANPVQVGVGSLPLPRNSIGRLLADLAAGAADAVRSAFRTRTPRVAPQRRYHHPQREAFIEDAAMSREMHRL